MEIQLDHVAINASDVARSAAFYADVLGLEDAYPGEWGGSPTIMMAPGSRTGVAIFRATAPGTGGARAHADRPAGEIDHLAFRTTLADQAALIARLRELGVEHEEQEFGICRSVFVRDPDGVIVEVTTYEGAVRTE